MGACSGRRGHKFPADMTMPARLLLLLSLSLSLSLTWPTQHLASGSKLLCHIIQAREELSLARLLEAEESSLLMSCKGQIFSPSNLTSKETTEFTSLLRWSLTFGKLEAAWCQMRPLKSELKLFLSENTDNLQQLALHACQPDGG